MIRKVHSNTESNTKALDTKADTSSEKLHPIQALTLLYSGLFNSLAIRLMLIFSFATLLSAAIADFVYPKLVAGSANTIITKLASSIDLQSLHNTTMDHYAAAGGAAWCYVSDPSRKFRIVYHSATLPSDVSYHRNTPRMLAQNGQNYYETATVLSNKNIMRMGFNVGNPLLPNLVSSNLQGLYLPAQYVFLLGFGIFIILVITLEVWVARPLNFIARAAHSFVSLRNTYSGLTATNLDIPGAVTEVQRVRKSIVEMRKQFDELNAARVAKDAEVRRLKARYENEKKVLVTDYQQQLDSTQHKLSELYTKEMEEEFLGSLNNELDLVRSSRQLCDRVLQKVNDRYPSSIVFGAFFKVDESLNCKLLSQLAFDAQSVQLLNRVNHFAIAQQLFGTGQHLHITRPAMGDYGLDALAQHIGIYHSIYMPLTFQQRHLGMFAFYIASEAVEIQALLRILRNVCDLAARALYQVLLYEEATKAARTDVLTGLPNRKFLDELFPIIVERAAATPAQNPVSVIVIHPDQLHDIAETSGRVAVDLMLKELAKELKSCITSPEWDQDKETHLVRFASEDFVIIIDRADSAYAIKTAKLLQEAVENKSTWPGGVPTVTVSQGISTYPNNGGTPADLVISAEAALFYGREQLGPGKIFHAGDVPAEYRSAKDVTVGGDLAVFDAAGLFQSVAASQKTGVLTVQSSKGSQLWTLFENGKLTQARLGKFKGETAVIESITTFEDGSFNFQEINAQLSGVKLPRLDDSYSVGKSLDRIVMDGALAQDNYRTARKVITSPDMVIKAAPQKAFTPRWDTLKNLENPPTSADYIVMEEIAQLADGSSTLAKIFKQLDTIPTHRLWHCCAVMLLQELVTVELPQTTTILSN